MPTPCHVNPATNFTDLVWNTRQSQLVLLEDQPRRQGMQVLLPSKHEALIQYWFSVGLPSTTLAQH